VLEFEGVRRVLAFLAVVGTTSCALLLDFDLTGGSVEDATPGDGPVDVDADHDAGPPAPPFLPFQCFAGFTLCDGFEDRTTPVGGIFNGVAGEKVALTNDPWRIASDKQSLEITASRSSGPETIALVSENNDFLVDNGRPFIQLQVILALEYQAPFNGERTILVVQPTPALDPSGPVARLVVRQTGIFVEMRRYDGARAWEQIPVDEQLLANGKYHTFDLALQFHDTRGFVRLGVDGDKINEARENLQTVETPPGMKFSFALGASATHLAEPLTARFDNVRVRIRTPGDE